MANSLSNIFPLIIAQGAPVLRESAVYSKYTNNSFSTTEAAEPGAVIIVPLSDAKTATAVTPGPVPPTPSDSNIQNKTITIDQWFKSDFFLSSKDIANMMDGGTNFINYEMQECFRAVGNQLNNAIAAKYKEIYGFVGTGASDPFNGSTSAIDQVNKVLTNQLAPINDRNLILTPNAYAQLGANVDFYTYARGNTNYMDNGRIQAFKGLGIDVSQLASTSAYHTAGTQTGSTVTGGSATAGATTVSVTGGSGTFLVGDIVTFATETGVNTTHVIESSVGGSSPTSITFSPALNSTIANGQAVTTKASHQVNLAMQRGCIGLAMRSLDESGVGGAGTMYAGTNSLTYTDPISGIVFRVDLIPTYHALQCEISVLYGVSVIRPQLGCRLAGL